MVLLEKDSALMRSVLLHLCSVPLFSLASLDGLFQPVILKISLEVLTEITLSAVNQDQPKTIHSYLLFHTQPWPKHHRLNNTKQQFALINALQKAKNQNVGQQNILRAVKA
jgi:hypothetical protein